MAANRTGQDAGPDPGQDSGPPKRRSRYARLKLSIGRHPSDLIRMAVAAAVVLGCRLIAAAPGTNPVETSITSQLQRLPAWSAPVWEGLTWLGWWPGIAAAVGLALYIGRIRLGMSLAMSAVAAWLLAVVVSWTLAPRLVPPGSQSGLIRVPGSTGFAFPDARTAVIAALASVAVPYLSRPARNTSWILVVLVAAGSVFLGQNLPVGVFAGAALGWGMGKLFHIVMGAPGRRTSESAVQRAVEQAGLQGARIVPVHRGLLRPLEYDLTASDGTALRMTIVRSLRRRAGPLHRLRNALASVEIEHEAGLSTPRHEVEHEAYATLLAQRAGVGTLPVVLAGEIEHGPPFLISQVIEGRLLSSLPATDISDSLLDAIWADVLALGGAHIAHHDLRAQNILVDRSGRPRICTFTFSRVGGPVGGYRQDAADLLVSMASVVGQQRAIASIRRAVPAEVLQHVLPYLQRLVLHRQLRRQLSAGAADLADLRESLAEQIEAPLPAFRLPVRPSTIIFLLIGGLAIYLLLPELSNIDQVLVLLARGDRRWLGTTVAIGFLAILASAVSILGSTTRRLPVGRTIAVQVAAAFTGRTTAAG
ncbi:MAG TPA: hypothetical protein VLI70_08855, partial [Micrococcaceae bacterium]|nr:hypothetical protein [Micrococcaceae bacterium]